MGTATPVGATALVISTEPDAKTSSWARPGESVAVQVLDVHVEVGPRPGP
ncbi:hypothetical protein [Streptomyces sp. NPDC092370]